MIKLKNFYPLILAGGSGTRLWPLSRELNPKQLLSLFGTESLIVQTVRRLLHLTEEEKIHLVASQNLVREIKTHLKNQSKPLQKIKYIVEPAPRNTAPAIALATQQIFKSEPEAIVAVFPSDHYIGDNKKFAKALSEAYQLASLNYLVTFGIKPTRPEIGFGYIKAGKAIAELNFAAFRAEKFVEKPPIELAEKFYQSKNHYWNGGIFIFKAELMLEELKNLMPELLQTLKKMENEALTPEEKSMLFEKITPISIDYGVMEKSKKVALIPVDFPWSDVGTLLSLEEFNPRDKKGNVIKGNVIDLDSQNSIIFAEEKLVATIGLNDMAVIDTHDATLIAPKNRLQEVKKVVETLKKKKAEEYFSPRTVERPWGSYTVLEKGQGYKIKLVKVKPQGKLSYQLHKHRSEHWVIISGTARITREKEVFELHPNESAFIPPSTPHRLENRGKRMLKLIEVQIGDYVEEDDIVRFDDIYGRDEKL